MSVQDAEKAEAAANLMAAFMDEPVQQQQDVEAQETASSPEVDDTPELEAEPAPSFEYSPEVPEDILAEIREAEIDDEVEQAIASRPATVEDDQYAEYESAESEQEVRERIKLQKRNEYLEAELAKTRASSWKGEALKYFPLSKHKLDSINATSRRAFLKAAKAEHEAILPYVQEALTEAKGFVDGARSEAVAEGREAAAKAFGKPLSGPDSGTVDAAAANADLENARADARKTGSLVELFKKMM